MKTDFAHHQELHANAAVHSLDHPFELILCCLEIFAQTALFIPLTISSQIFFFLSAPQSTARVLGGKPRRNSRPNFVNLLTQNPWG
jgi:hypothetical protein